MLPYHIVRIIQFCGVDLAKQFTLGRKCYDVELQVVLVKNREV